MSNVQRPGVVGTRRGAGGPHTSQAALSPSSRVASVGVDADDQLTPEQKELLLDLAQLVLDVVGIFEPTPFADSTNALVSVVRGDWAGAGLSMVGVVPYVGDAAKAGKLGRYAKTLERAIAEAKRSRRVSEFVRPLLVRLQALLHSPVIATLPDAARKHLEKMRLTLDQSLGPFRLTDDVIEALLRDWMKIAQTLPLRPPGKDRGILWSKVGADRAKKIADSLTAFAPKEATQARGVVTLEELLDESVLGWDFPEAFEKWRQTVINRFGASKEVSDWAWEKLGMPVWGVISRRYAALLEGRVQVYVDAKRLGLRPGSRIEDAVLYDELDELTELMRTNTKVEAIRLIDTNTGELIQTLGRDLVRSLGSVTQ